MEEKQMTKKQAIEKKIREVCVETMELKFGCEIYNEQAIEDIKGNTHDLQGVIIDVDKRGNNTFYCVRYYADGMSDEYQGWLEEDEIQEIIGSPLTLEHLLRTIDTLKCNCLSVGKTSSSCDNCADTQHTLPDEKIEWGSKELYTTEVNWWDIRDIILDEYNLSLSLSDNLEQNPDLCDFIEKLILM